jgi:UDP:flavonoid glycosyltransferase YjiC (YdhE family)
MSRRILITWEYGFGLGHLGHVAAAAEGFRTQGCSVWLAVKRPDLLYRLPPIMVDAVLAAPTLQRPIAAIPINSMSDILAAIGFDDPNELEGVVRAWQAVFDVARPDLVIGEYAPCALFAAQLRGLPTAMLGTGFMAPPASDPMPAFSAAAQNDIRRRRASDERIFRPMQEVAQRIGSAGPFPPSLGALNARALPLLTTWREFDHYGARPSTPYFGPLRGAGGTARPDWPDLPGPRIFAYFGGDKPAPPAVLEALRRTRWPAILYAPADRLPEADHWTIASAPVDLAHVAGRADLVMSRVGHGTICEVARAGTPQLFLPHTSETVLLATAACKAGLGLARHARSVNADDIIVLSEKILTSDPIRQRCEASWKALQRYDGVEAAKLLAATALRRYGLDASRHTPLRAAAAG